MANLTAECRELVHRWVHVLSGEIGIRFAGTAGERRAADFIESEFGRIFPEVKRHEYRFLGWRPIDEGRLEIDGDVLPTCLGISCPATPEEGVTGQLRSIGSSTYGIWEEGAAGPSAHIMAYTAGLGGDAIPLLWSPYGSMPAGIVGRDMEEPFQTVAQAGGEVTFTCRTEFSPGALSWNIEGVLPGDPGRHIVVVGHYDTVYVSPGANDNAASAACLPALGKWLRGQERAGKPTLHFLATGGEEIDLQGARCYVRDLVWRGEADAVVLALNFDSLTWGDTVKVGASGSAERMLPELDEAFAATRFSTYWERYQREGIPAGVDAAIFHRAGVPTININTSGDEETSALWHTAEDTEERVPWARVEDGVALFGEFLARVD